MPRIKLQPSGEIYSYEAGGALLEILLFKKIFLENPCGGKGVCGKCRVRMLGANVPEPTKTEKKWISEKDLESGIRLACLVRPTEDIEISLPDKERGHEVLTGGYVPEFSFDRDIEKRIVRIHKPTLKDQTPFEDQVREQLVIENISFEVLRDTAFLEDIVTAVIYNGEVIALEPGDTTSQIYGAAIDIGTTTVVCTLVDMLSGRELALSSMINAQKIYGQDVLTRITYETEHPEDGIERLQKSIVDSINEMIIDICAQADISRGSIYEICVSANCTMMHMLLGVDAAFIGRAPYAPMFVKARDIEASLIGVKAAKGARLYCLPSVSAYIGADIVAGAYVCGLEKEKGNTLFIDIGTNGEIVLSRQGRLISCSCAAGPALEGMNISAGMRAAEGAIEDVKIGKDGVELTVIGEGEPAGICGSGILAAVKELVKHGLVSKSGAFVRKEGLEEADYRYPMIRMNGKKREFMLTKELLITQGDIRQVQLAKGAILSGFVALLGEAGIEMADLDKVMIAGQFGAHLPAESLTGTGILPKEVEDKIIYVGNSSKTGAYMALMSKKAKRDMERLAQHMDYMELGATKGYERLFSDCLLFPDSLLFPGGR